MRTQLLRLIVTAAAICFLRQGSNGYAQQSSRILASWTPPPVEEQRRSWEGVATRPGTLNIRDATNYVLSLPVSTSSSAATTSRRSKKTCESPASSHPCPRPRWPPSPIKLPLSQDKLSSSTSKAARGSWIYRTNRQRIPGRRLCATTFRANDAKSLKIV